MHTREMDALPYVAFRRGPVQSMVCVSSEMGNEWFARLVLIDARVGERRERELRFAESLGEARNLSAVQPVPDSPAAFARGRDGTGTGRSRIA